MSELIQQQIKDFLPQESLVFLLCFLCIRFIIKRMKFKYCEINIGNIKKSATISVAFAIFCGTILNPVIVQIICRFNIVIGSMSTIFVYAVILIIEVFPVILAIEFNRENLYSIGITGKNFLKSISIAFISYFLYFIFAIMIRHKFDYINIDYSFLNLWMFIYFIIVGLTEEIIFRGYVQTRLIKCIGISRGVVITAFIFCFSHIPQRMICANFNFTSALASSIILLPTALFLGYLFFKTRNIITSTIFHALFNFLVNVI